MGDTAGALVTTMAAANRESEAPEGNLEHREAYEVLWAMADQRFGAIDAGVIARHALHVARGADWPVVRGALEAMVRRWRSAQQNELRVARRPKGGIGTYVTRRRRSATRPYRTELAGIDPLSASCDCPDFLRNALGLCKHVLVALDDLHRRRPQTGAAATGQGLRPVLRWQPIRPMTGADDWLERIVWQAPETRGQRKSGRYHRARRWFAWHSDGSGRVANTHRGKPAERLAMVRDLLTFATLADAGGHSHADAATTAVLGEECTALEQRAAASLRATEVGHHLKSLARKLYPYQRDGVLRLCADRHLLLADDMGLGKTAQATAICHVLWRANKARRGLLLVPASLKQQWLREWKLFTSTPIACVEGGPSERQRIYDATKRGFLVANYEQLLRDRDLILRWRPDIVVLDEAQRIKNWSTKTAASVKSLAPTYRLVLTGTPMENRLEELHSILEWVDPYALEPAWRLAPWHSKTVDGSRECVGVRNLDTLRARIEPAMLRRVRANVLSQLPARTDTRVPVELAAEQLDDHDALNRPIAQLVRASRQRPLGPPEFLKLMSLLTRQRMICNGLALAQFDEVWPTLERVQPTPQLIRAHASPKLDELRELVTRLIVDQGRKIVLFSQWRRMLRLVHWAVRDVLDGAGLHAVFFTGEERLDRRTQNVVAFHDDPRCRLMLATDAGGVGLNLQRAANCCINVELPWNPAVLEQRIGRIYRLGQKDPIEVYNLVSEAGIESRIAELVGNKQAFFKGLFDGQSDQIDFARSGSFLTRLRGILEPAACTCDSSDEDTDVLADEQIVQPSLGDTHAEAASSTSVDQGESHTRASSTATQSLGSGDDVQPPSVPAISSLMVQHVSSLFSRITFAPSSDGGLTISAPPDAAAALGALLQGLGTVLARASQTQP